MVAPSGAPTPEVYHTNEGHAGFLGVERITELVRDHGLTFDEALEAVRAATVFTTHTPVPAGIDRFDAAKINLFFGGANAIPGVPVERLLALGAEDYEGGQPGIFNMAVMGLRLAQRANGVSQLHGVVSREMFDGLWPGFDDVEVPITSITNGVHAPTWVDRARLRRRSQAPRHRRHRRPGRVGAHRRGARRRGLGDQARDARAARRPTPVAASRPRGTSVARADAELGWVDDMLDPDVLTIGFARRVPTYKRLTLMLRDPERLKRLLLHPERPVQLVIAGKSHPADETGKRLIQEMVRFADDPEVRHRIVFLPNYDIAMAQHLYPGCDVWLNNPLRPFEACGTSGMKAALNGGLNLSILDGWWDEWFDGRNGWAIPTADGVEDADRRDDIEASALYDLIENDVAAKFYDRDAAGLPQGWIDDDDPHPQDARPEGAREPHGAGLHRAALQPRGRCRALGRRRRTSPAPRTSPPTRRRSARRGRRSRSSTSSPRACRTRRRSATCSTCAPTSSLDGLTPDDVEVQLVHGHVNDVDELWGVEVAPLALVESYEDGRHQFAGSQALRRTGSFGYSVRVVPQAPGLAGPAELGLARNA